MLSCLRVAEPFRKSEVNDVNVMLLLANANQEVVWLDIPMQEMP